MRALVVVLALVATPFLAGVSQSPQGSICDNGQGDEHRSDSGQAHAHQGQCAQPQPPPACVNSGPGVGAGSITGQVFIDQSPFDLQGGWCVELRDVNGAVIATALSSPVPLDPLDPERNNYLFTGVPNGTYTVCEVLLSDIWLQSSPAPPIFTGPDCGGGVLGYTAMVEGAMTLDFLSFGNLLK